MLYNMFSKSLPYIKWSNSNILDVVNNYKLKHLHNQSRPVSIYERRNSKTEINFLLHNLKNVLLHKPRVMGEPMNFAIQT